ncbi:MAG: hypothetical protein MRZ40_04935 [Ligilactobacillus animalis]|uniref:hypothetical protein n=2 Tax=Ligilactobacillus animalis TaxID=1605 RepID=UPI00242B5219|nr:hypothetical protein [Ligilactobacillus animalis]MCI5941898.1 hypothetical protein [Ligilactobacillus animalis]
MSHSGLKLSVLTKVGLIFLVVALSVAGVYLVTQVATPLPAEVPLEGKFFINAITLIGTAIGSLIGFLVIWGIGLLVIIASDQGDKEALFLALVIVNCLLSVFSASYIVITGSVFGSAYVNNILQILLFGVIYYQLSKQDKRGTLYLTGTYAVLEVIGIVVVMLIK